MRQFGEGGKEAIAEAVAEATGAVGAVDVEVTEEA